MCNILQNMWYPSSACVPIYFEPSSRLLADRSTSMMFPMVSVDQHVYLARSDVVEHCLAFQDGRKFLLNKSIYSLVEVSHFLELTDPRLLCWYLALPAEDRKLIEEEGGLLQFLQRHPALKVTRHIVHLNQQIVGSYTVFPVADMTSHFDKSRRSTFYGASQCLNCGKSFAPGAKKCRYCNLVTVDPEENVCISEEQKTHRLLPKNVRQDSFQSTLKNLSVPQSSSSNSYQQAYQQGTNSSKDQPLWQGVSNGTMDYEESSAQASFSLDVELEMRRHAQSKYQDQKFLVADTSAEGHKLDQETTPEYYSFHSSNPEHLSGQLSDTKEIADASPNNEPVETSVLCGPENDSVFYNSSNSEWTDLTDCHDLSNEDDLQCETKIDEYHSMTEEQPQSSAVCASQVPSRQTSESTPDRFSSCKVIISSDFSELEDLNAKATTSAKKCLNSMSTNKSGKASSDSKGCFTLNKATETSPNYFRKPCSDVSSGPESSTINCDQGTQTNHSSTSEKSTATEIHDLDALSEEFGKLKMTKMELKPQKNKMARSGSGRQDKWLKSSCGCDAIQRARWAELRLLALQYAMCQQHCYRRFYTSSLGEIALQGTGALSNEMSQTLKSLQDDYLMVKQKIIAGVPLDDLKPLSVDTLRITRETSYSPSLIWEDCLRDILRQEPSLNTGDESQTDQTDEMIKKTDRELLNKNTAPLQSSGISSKRSRAVAVLSQKLGARGNTKSELNSSETWFDAKEELGSDCWSCKEDNHIKQSGDSKMEQKEKLNGDRHRFDLCVSNFPSSVTERDILLWFKKYGVTRVRFSTCNNNRVAVMSVRSPGDAEAAVSEMNGQLMQGYNLHVEHIHKYLADGQNLIKESCAELPPNDRTAKSAGDELPTQRLNNFQTSTYCGTMGSFDTIMACLSKRHPQVDGQRIFGALLELQAKHQGVLSGLPLREIVEMTSDLLTQQAKE